MQANVPNALRKAAIGLIAVLAAACQLPGLDRVSGAEGATDRAARQSRQGDYAAAARTYESAARAAPPAEANALWLAAAGEWIAGGDFAAAQNAIGMLAPPVSAAEAREKLRLEAELALARGETERALAMLRDLPPDGNANMLATRARIQFAALRVAQAVNSLIERERLLTNAGDRESNQRMIVEGIGIALDRGADAKAPAGADAVLTGWLELGRIISDAGAGALGAPRRLQGWRERFPTHPANESLWRGLVERRAGAGDLPRQIALLLPLSGRAEAAGVAVRDGFIAAYYDYGSADRPRLHIYDVSARDAPSSYLQALTDGCDFVVGPLTREEVAALASVADGRATTLALNFLPDGVQVPDRFYQYALSPEDEARLAARRIAADGRLSGVTLAPQSDWGRRVQAAFADEFSAAGGRLVDHADYPPSTADFNDLLRRLLLTTGQRGSAPRSDAQFIFVAAQPVHGRLIRSQLRFNYAGALPMYATSDVFDGASQGNFDLDGVIFPDMPWVLDPHGPSAAAREAAERAWPGRSNALGRLHAFGYDAFRLIGDLRRLRGNGSTPLPGVTGRLAVDREGRVRRELDWAQVVQGKPVPLP
jgi:outer membrane PBP1 activator LpoA protein